MPSYPALHAFLAGAAALLYTLPVTLLYTVTILALALVKVGLCNFRRCSAPIGAYAMHG
jgi:hypothetical protein